MKQRAKRFVTRGHNIKYLLGAPRGRVLERIYARQGRPLPEPPSLTVACEAGVEHTFDPEPRPGGNPAPIRIVRCECRHGSWFAVTHCAAWPIWTYDHPSTKKETV